MTISEKVMVMYTVGLAFFGIAVVGASVHFLLGLVGGAIWLLCMVVAMRSIRCPNCRTQVFPFMNDLMSQRMHSAKVPPKCLNCGFVFR